MVAWGEKSCDYAKPCINYTLFSLCICLGYTPTIKNYGMKYAASEIVDYV